MFSPTPQERRALLTIAVLLLTGNAARYIELREAGEELKVAAEAADTLNDGTSSTLRSAVEREIAAEQDRSRPLADGEKLDPNRASAEELDRLNGIGPKAAAAIVEYRKVHGDFQRIDDLEGVPGIGPATINRIRSHLDLPERRAASSRPRLTNLNRATALDLQALPGVGPSLAARIVESRDELGPFREWSDLERVNGIGPRLRERLEGSATLGP